MLRFLFVSTFFKHFHSSLLLLLLLFLSWLFECCLLLPHWLAVWYVWCERNRKQPRQLPPTRAHTHTYTLSHTIVHVQSSTQSRCLQSFTWNFFQLLKYVCVLLKLHSSMTTVWRVEIVENARVQQATDRYYTYIFVCVCMCVQPKKSCQTKMPVNFLVCWHSGNCVGFEVCRCR